MRDVIQRMAQALLSIETSGPSSGVALHVDGISVFSDDQTGGSLHGKALAPQIEKALASASLQPAGLSAIAVSIGPGSWTGLRIGLSVAKAMAWGLQIPLVTVPTFEALIVGVVQAQPVLCVRDARSEGCFAALFHETLRGPARLIKECVAKPAALIEQALAFVPASQPVAVCGDDISVNAVLSEARARALNWVALPDRQQVKAKDLGSVAWRLFSGCEMLKTAAEVHAAGPLYLRPSGPEIVLAQKLAQQAVLAQGSAIKQGA